jgi:hypothetical protein
MALSSIIHNTFSRLSASGYQHQQGYSISIRLSASLSYQHQRAISIRLSGISIRLAPCASQQVGVKKHRLQYKLPAYFPTHGFSTLSKIASLFVGILSCTTSEYLATIRRRSEALSKSASLLVGVLSCLLLNTIRQFDVVQWLSQSLPHHLLASFPISDLKDCLIICWRPFMSLMTLCTTSDYITTIRCRSEALSKTASLCVGVLSCLSLTHNDNSTRRNGTLVIELVSVKLNEQDWIDAEVERSQYLATLPHSEEPILIILENKGVS